MNIYRQITKNASSTFYYSTLFFPKAVQEDVYKLYAFVRTVDDLVDSIPPQRQRFYRFEAETARALAGTHSRNPLITSFVEVYHKYGFKRAWLKAFFHSQALDLQRQKYRTAKELGEFVYGVAEVIGLMMSKVLGLSEKAQVAAQLQGRAMQLLNIIRDITEDSQLGRVYLPQDEMHRFQLKNLQPKNEEEKQKFIKFIRWQLAKYFKLQKQAEAGYRFIPKTYLGAVRTAAASYRWIAEQINENPLVILDQKIKPSPGRVLYLAIKNTWFTI